MLAYVWAQDQNGIIGQNGKLPWHLPADMHHFQKLTTHHLILAGRKTFLSFGRPLPHRKNMVLTRRPASDFPKEVTVFNNPDEFMKFAEARPQTLILIVGGAQIFKIFASKVDRLYRTVINGNFDGDTKMPSINYHKFKRVSQSLHSADSHNHWAYRFESYVRIRQGD